MKNTIEVDLGHARYSIITGTGDTFYIEPTDDWIATLGNEIYNDFHYRLEDLEDMYAGGSYDYCEECWDDPKAVKDFLDILHSSYDAKLLAEAWTFSNVWGWVKVIDNITGDTVFESYGNGDN
jgi:hypothetical protein